MDPQSKIKGVIAAVVTPLDEKNRPHLINLQKIIRSLKAEGVHGILLLGTTGEGPSMSMGEQEEILSAGMEAANGIFVLTCIVNVSIMDAVASARKAAELGVDGIVALPPYYYKNIKTEGLLSYFYRLLDDGIPDDKKLFLYHIPQLTAVPITVNVLEGLLKYDESRIGGVKDSEGDLSKTIDYCRIFPQLNIFVGTDRLLLDGIQNGAAGCVTAGANVLAPLDVAVYNMYIQGGDAQSLQEKLTKARLALEKYPPFPPTLKSLLNYRFNTPGWDVRAPLLPLDINFRNKLISDLQGLELDEFLPWLSANNQRAG